MRRATFTTDSTLHNYLQCVMLIVFALTRSLLFIFPQTPALSPCTEFNMLNTANMMQTQIDIRFSMYTEFGTHAQNFSWFEALKKMTAKWGRNILRSLAIFANRKQNTVGKKRLRVYPDADTRAQRKWLMTSATNTLHNWRFGAATLFPVWEYEKIWTYICLG